MNVVLGALNLSWENYQGGSAGLFFQHPAHSLYLILSPLIESLPEIELQCACKAEGCGMGDVLEQDGNQECSRSGTGRIAHQLWSACITPVATQVPPRLCYREVTTHLFTLDWLLLHRAPSSESPLCEVNSEERTDNAACKLVTSVTGNATQVKARRCHDATLSSCSTNHICRPCRVSRSPVPSKSS